MKKINIDKVIEDNIIKNPFKLEYNTCNSENAIKQVIREVLPEILQEIESQLSRNGLLDCEAIGFTTDLEDEILEKLGI